MRAITVSTIAAASVFTLAVSPWAVTVLTARADGPDLGLVSADAVWLMHLDVEAALETRLGRLVFDAGSSRLDLEGTEIGEGIGIDPMREIKRITAYGFSGEDGHGVVIMEATPAIDLVIEELKKEQGDVSAAQVEGYDILRWDEGVASIRADGAVGRVLVFGPEENALLKALRVIDNALPSLADAPASALRREARAGAFFTINVPDLELMRSAIDGTADMPELLQAAQAFRLEIGEASGIAFLDSAFATRGGEDSSDIAAVAQGLLAMARLMLREEPELAQLDPLLRAISINSEGASVKIVFEMPADALPEPAERAGDGSTGAGDGGSEHG
jgi:hypothetical protein